MFFKNEKGIAMGMAIIIGLVITVSGIVLWQVSTNDTLQVERDENSTQAFFYAKSGVELAVGLLQDDPDYLAHGEEASFYGNLDEPTYSSTETDDYNIYFEIERDNNDYFIRSTGIVRVGSAQGAQAAANSLGFVINMQQLEESVGMGGGGGGGGQIPPLDMIFSLGDIELTGSSQIVGNTGTNSVAEDSVVLAWSTVINGLLSIGPGGDPATVIDTRNYAGNLPQGTAALPSARSYPMPEFPEFPDLPFQGFMDAGWWPIPPGGHRISETGTYSYINVQNELTIDIGDEDLLIRTESLSVTGSGKIKLNKTGSGRLILYVDNTFNINGSSTINQNGNYNDVIMYYAGSGNPSIDGSTKYVGSIYAVNSNFTVAGSGGVTGHIVTGGTTVNVTGNAEANVRAVYAPNAVLTVSGSSRIRGAVVAQSINVLGNSRIFYDDSLNLEFFQLLDWGSGEAGEPADWRAIGQWQRL